jgi:hypothetical protein
MEVDTAGFGMAVSVGADVAAGGCAEKVVCRSVVETWRRSNEPDTTRQMSRQEARMSIQWILFLLLLLLRGVWVCRGTVVV